MAGSAPAPSTPKRAAVAFPPVQIGGKSSGARAAANPMLAAAVRSSRQRLTESPAPSPSGGGPEERAAVPRASEVEDIVAGMKHTRYGIELAVGDGSYVLGLALDGEHAPLPLDMPVGLRRQVQATLDCSGLLAKQPAAVRAAFIEAAHTAATATAAATGHSASGASESPTAPRFRLRASKGVLRHRDDDPFKRFAVSTSCALPPWLSESLTATGVGFKTSSSALLVFAFFGWTAPVAAGTAAAVGGGAVTAHCASRHGPVCMRPAARLCRDGMGAVAAAVGGLANGASISTFMLGWGLSTLAGAGDAVAPDAAVPDWQFYTSLAVGVVTALVVLFNPSTRSLVPELEDARRELEDLLKTAMDDDTPHAERLAALNKFHTSMFGEYGRRIYLKKAKTAGVAAANQPPKFLSVVKELVGGTTSIRKLGDYLDALNEMVGNEHATSGALGALLAATLLGKAHYVVDSEFALTCCGYGRRTVTSCARRSPCCAWTLKCASEFADLLAYGAGQMANAGYALAGMAGLCGRGVIATGRLGMADAAVAGGAVTYAALATWAVMRMRGLGFNPVGSDTQKRMKMAVQHATGEAATEILRREFSEVFALMHGKSGDRLVAARAQFNAMLDAARAQAVTDAPVVGAGADSGAAGEGRRAAGARVGGRPAGSRRGLAGASPFADAAHGVGGRSERWVELTEQHGGRPAEPAT